MEIIKKNYTLIFLFFFFLGWNLMISPLNLDEIWNYGFARNIFIGEIPYKDFNMVITPLYPSLMSLGMHIFGNNMLFFHIENAIVLTILFFFLKELIGKKSWFLLPLWIWPINVSYPSYNLFSLFLVVLILYLETKEKKDIWIGLITGLLILTKQSIGIPISLVMLFYWKDKERLKKRFLSMIVPILLFTLYLLVTKSFSSFIDLCFLGLIDFNEKNGHYNTFLFILSLFFLGLSLLLFQKDKTINNMYLIAFISMVFPIFDYYHFQLYFILFIIVFFNSHKEIDRLAIGVGKVLLGMILLLTLIPFSFDESLYPNDISHFKYRYLTKTYIKNTKESLALIKKYQDKVVIIGPDSYYHKIILDKKIDSLDLINYGNWGYHGTEKIKEKIKELEEDYVFFVNKEEIGKSKQTNQEIINYIIDNGEIIEKTTLYDIYRLNKKRPS